MFIEERIDTVGQLCKLLERFPDDKPILLDYYGNTCSPKFYNWNETADQDIKHPLAIDCSELYPMEDY